MIKRSFMVEKGGQEREREKIFKIFFVTLVLYPKAYRCTNLGDLLLFPPPPHFPPPYTYINFYRTKSLGLGQF